LKRDFRQGLAGTGSGTRPASPPRKSGGKGDFSSANSGLGLPLVVQAGATEAPLDTVQAWPALKRIRAGQEGTGRAGRPEHGFPLRSRGRPKEVLVADIRGVAAPSGVSFSLAGPRARAAGVLHATAAPAGFPWVASPPIDRKRSGFTPRTGPAGRW